MKHLDAAILTMSLVCSLLPCTAIAGYAEFSEALYLKKDYARALREFQSPEVQTNPKAQIAVADMYINGNGVQKDYKEAVKWLSRAAAQGDGFAEVMLSDMYEIGYQNVVPKDLSYSVRLRASAIHHGELSEQYNLARIYENGRGVPANRVIAYSLYHLRATYPDWVFNKDAAAADRDRLATSMTNTEIEAAKALAIELYKTDNFLIALDRFQYGKK